MHPGCIYTIFQAVTTFVESGDTKPTGDNMRKLGENVADKQALLRFAKQNENTHYNSTSKALLNDIVHEC